MGDTHDWLSWCPALLDILEFIGFYDVCGCQLVNRRFRDVIERNKHRFTRPTTEITIEMKTKYTSALVFQRKCSLKIEDGEGESHFTLEERKIYVKQCNVRYICDYMKKQGSAIKGTKEKPEAYRTLGIEDELIAILSLVFRRRYVSMNITKFALLEEKWFKSIVFYIQHFHSKCLSLKVDAVWTGVNDFCSQLGCQKVFINSHINERLSENLFFDKITIWDKLNIKMILLPENFDSLAPVLDFLKKWQAGECNIVELVFLSYAYLSTGYRWSNDEVVDAFSCLQCTEVTHLQKSEGFYSKSVRMKFERFTDGACLCVQYSTSESKLLIKTV